MTEFDGIKEHLESTWTNGARQLYEEEGLKSVDIHTNHFAVGRLTEEMYDHLAGLRVARGPLYLSSTLNYLAIRIIKLLVHIGDFAGRLRFGLDTNVLGIGI
uniref:Uncharacterized protein n=1 Tax=viral metagenome TaxID=1070528 RepID=A0A6C0DDE1_9ZZZZ